MGDSKFLFIEKKLIIYEIIKYFLLKLSFIPNDDRNVLSCFRKLFMCLRVNFYFLFTKTKGLTKGVEYLLKVLETVAIEVYVHRAKLCPFFLLTSQSK